MYQLKDGNNFFIEANFDPKFKDDAIAEIKEGVRSLNKINKDELKRAKKRTLTDFVETVETVSDIADSIGNYVTVFEDIRYAKEYEKTLECINENYLQEIAQKYLNEENCAIGTVMPKDEENEAH